MGKDKKLVNNVGFSATLQLTLTTEVISTILSDGLVRGYCGFDDVDFDDADYHEAREALIKNGAADQDLCIEDVQAAMLMLGKKIRLHMLEEEPNEGWYGLTLEGLINGLRMYADKGGHGTILDVLNGDPDSLLDSDDYDAILQYATFGEYVVG